VSEDAIDFTVSAHGSIYVLMPRTTAAREWGEEHIQQDGMRWCGGYAVEARLVCDIVDSAREDGLTVEHDDE